MNEEIIKLAKQEIATLKINIPKGNHIKTGDIRYLDKLIDELAKGKAMDKILRG
jgi:hypothetical protein